MSPPAGETRTPDGDPITGAHGAIPDRSSATDLLSGEDRAEVRRYNSVASAVAMLLVGLAGGAAPTVMPGVLSAFVAAGEATSSQSSRLGAFELAGITLSMFGAGVLLATVNRRRLALFSVLAILIGQYLSAWPHSIDVLLVTRLCVGVAEGVVIATVTAAIASMASPERVFALWFSLNLIVSAGFYAALPLLMSLSQAKAVMCALAGLAVPAALALPWFPSRAPLKVTAPAGGQRTATDHYHIGPVSLAFSASLTLYAGMGAVWPLMAQIGRSNDVNVGTVTTALSAASFVGVLSGLFTSWLGLRLGRAIPVIVGTLGLSVAMISLLVPGASIFVFAAVSFMAWWIFNGTYYLGVVSAMDRSGRLAALTLAIMYLGLTVGQFLAASLLRSGSYRPLIMVGASLAVIALLPMMLAMRSSSYRASMERR